jgi:SAM-dependent methyltransferase
VLIAEVAAFVGANLPLPPARILEIGAGGGELARMLRARGYSVIAIDPEPSAEDVEPLPLVELDAGPGSFDAASAVVALHHVDPLDTSCENLARVLRRGARLVVDEFDVDAFDEREATWWLGQRGARGAAEEVDPAELVERLRSELHSVARLQAALAGDFEVGHPVRGPYLYRWELDARVRPLEEELIASGELTATGARFVGIRR